MIPPTGAARAMERPVDQPLTNTCTEQLQAQDGGSTLDAVGLYFVVCE